MIYWIYGINVIDDAGALNDLTNPDVISAMKLMQFITTGLGMFLIPAILATVLFNEHPRSFLNLNKPGWNIIILTIATIFAAIPVINVLLVFNSNMILPEFLAPVEQWMKDSEEQAARITESFLVMNSTSDLIYNLFIIALLPALGEEFLFRGVLQRLFKELTGNVHWAILITAALFSAVHMQFYGFLPRMFLGILFGYLLIWSGSIWVPVIAHLINNATAVIFSFFASRNELPFNQDTIGTEEGDIPMAIVSVVLISAFAYLIRKIRLNQKSEIIP